MTELTALLTKALLSTTFGVNMEQRYSADELRNALARASGSVSETRKVLSAQPEVDDISVESVANHLRDRLSKYIDVGSDSVGHSFPVLGHNIRVSLPQLVTMYEPGDPTGSQSPQPHLEDGTTYRPLRPTTAYGRYRRLRDVARQSVDSPRTRNSRSVTLGIVCSGLGESWSRHYNPSSLVAVPWY